MKLVFFCNVLNHHQASVADEFNRRLGENFVFVETTNFIHNKGSTEDYSTRPYLLQSWKTKKAYQKAMFLALESEVCVFSGYEALPFQKERLKKGLFSFDMSERLLKKGWLNLASPRIIKMVMSYYLGFWEKKVSLQALCGWFCRKRSL